MRRPEKDDALCMGVDLGKGWMTAVALVGGRLDQGLFNDQPAQAVSQQQDRPGLLNLLADSLAVQPEGISAKSKKKRVKQSTMI